MKLLLFLYRIYFKVLTTLSLDHSSKQAFSLFQKTLKANFKKREQHFYNNAAHFLLNTSIGTINAYECGDINHPSVVLIHGWNSNAGSMASIAQELVGTNHHVITIDLPAHGRDHRTRTNILDCTAAVSSLINRIHSDEPISIISHSFGSLVTANALKQTQKPIKNLILLTCPDTSTALFKVFTDQLSLSDAIYKQMVKMADDLLGEPLEGITEERLLKESHFETLTLIHDKMDKILPYENSEKLHHSIPSSQLIPFYKIGHYRMLGNEEVLKEITRRMSTPISKKSKLDKPVTTE